MDLILFLCLWLVFSVAGLVLAGMLFDGNFPADVVLLLAVGGALFCVRNRDLGDLGLQRERALPLWGVGSMVGAVGVSVYVAILSLAGWYRVEGTGETIGVLGTVGILLISAIWQELVFRGVVFRLLAQMSNLWIGVIVSALIFGLAHLANEDATLAGVVSGPALTGIWLALAYVLSRNLWTVIGLHFGVNVTAVAVFDLVQIDGLESGLLEASVVGPKLWVSGSWGGFSGLVQVLFEIAVIVVLVVVYLRRGSEPASGFRAR